MDIKNKLLQKEIQPSKLSKNASKDVLWLLGYMGKILAIFNNWVKSYSREYD